MVSLFYVIFVFNLKNVLIIHSAVCFCFVIPFRYTCFFFNASVTSVEGCRLELKLSYGGAGLRSVYLAEYREFDSRHKICRTTTAFNTVGAGACW
jgi:hypothetical protein